MHLASLQGQGWGASKSVPFDFGGTTPSAGVTGLRSEVAGEEHVARKTGAEGTEGNGSVVGEGAGRDSSGFTSTETEVPMVDSDDVIVMAGPDGDVAEKRVLSCPICDAVVATERQLENSVLE